MFEQLSTKSHECVPSIEEFKYACIRANVKLDPDYEEDLIKELDILKRSNIESHCAPIKVRIIKDEKSLLIDGLITRVKHSILQTNCAIILDE